MSVAKPWMLASPAPLTSHSLAGLPGLVFSQATGLVTGGSHGAAAPAGVARGRDTSPGSASKASKARRRPPYRRAPTGLLLDCFIFCIRFPTVDRDARMRSGWGGAPRGPPGPPQSATRRTVVSVEGPCTRGIHAVEGRLGADYPAHRAIRPRTHASLTRRRRAHPLESGARSEAYGRELVERPLASVSAADSVRITCAAGPTTTLHGGTLRVTTAPAPTTLSCPMVTPLRMIARLPTQTRSSIMTGRTTSSAPGKACWSLSTMITSRAIMQSRPMLTEPAATTSVFRFKYVPFPIRSVAPFQHSSRTPGKKAQFSTSIRPQFSTRGKGPPPRTMMIPARWKCRRSHSPRTWSAKPPAWRRRLTRCRRSRNSPIGLAPSLSLPGTEPVGSVCPRAAPSIRLSVAPPAYPHDGGRVGRQDHRDAGVPDRRDVYPAHRGAGVLTQAIPSPRGGDRTSLQEHAHRDRHVRPLVDRQQHQVPFPAAPAGRD